MIALYDYDPQELSPNVDAEVELKFHTGDLIDVYGEMDDDGFFLAELRGVRGLVPSNFLTEAPASVGGGGIGVMGQDKSKLNMSGASGPPPPPRDTAHTLKSAYLSHAFLNRVGTHPLRRTAAACYAKQPGLPTDGIIN